MIRSGVRVPVGAGAPSGVSTLAARVIADVDRRAGGPVPVLICFPGGGMSGRYFEITGFDMAAHLAAEGIVVVTIDHPAIGDSDVPDDPWLLTPEMVGDADAAAAAWVLEQVRAGSLVDGLPPLSDIVP